MAGSSARIRRNRSSCRAASLPPEGLCRKATAMRAVRQRANLSASWGTFRGPAPRRRVEQAAASRASCCSSQSRYPPIFQWERLGSLMGWPSNSAASRDVTSGRVLSHSAICLPSSPFSRRRLIWLAEGYCGSLTILFSGHKNLFFWLNFGLFWLLICLDRNAERKGNGQGTE